MPHLVNKIATCNKTSSFDNFYLGDSLPALQEGIDRNNDMKLVGECEECAKNTLNPHDALEHCKAVKAVRPTTHDTHSGGGDTHFIFSRKEKV